MSKILVCIPMKPQMHEGLKAKCVELVDKMLVSNSLHEISVRYDDRPVPSEPTDSRPWSKVTRARNMMLSDIDLKAFDYLLWIDADVVEYPPDMPTRLIAANPEGVCAPLVLIEAENRFYDWAAFIIKGRSHIQPNNRWNLIGRNLQHDPPYWPTKQVGNVECDCVGTITLVNTDIYKDGTRYEDHPAFTDHFPICQSAKRLGRKVVCATDVVARHANLPKWGEAWH